MKPLLRNPEIERVILEDPLDPDGWLVYGDWLQSEGDPRGELVAVQARHARDPGNPELLDAQKALLRVHGDALLEGLHDYFRPGGPDARLRVSWEFGFLWTATIEAFGDDVTDYASCLRALRDHPSAHFLHALTLGCPPENDWPVITRILAGGPERPLRILFVGDSMVTQHGHPRPAFGALGDLSAIWRTVPHLRVLALRGGRMNVGALELPHLRELTIETSALQRDTLLALGSREWPDLERLELWFGGRGCTCSLPDLEPILDGSLFPRLRHLALRNCSFVDRICMSLPTANITKQLHVLDLSLGALTEAGVSALIAGRRALENLAVLDLHHHYVSELDTLPGVSTLARFVDASHAVYAEDNDVEPGTPKVWLDA